MDAAQYLRDKAGITPKTFYQPEHVEKDYQNSLNRFLLRYLRISARVTVEDVRRLFDRLSSDQSFLDQLSRKYVRRMITHASKSNARSWRQAAAKSGKGRMIYEMLQTEMQGAVGIRVNEIVEENAKLISSIPQKIAPSVTKRILEWQQEGLRQEEIVRRLRPLIPRLTKNHVRLIARTEASKAATALSEARSEDLGIKFYQWTTSRDQRVRESHRDMEGVLVPWSDPPNPDKLARIKSNLSNGHAGQFPNCRCIPLPLISLNEVSWPAKVYSHGRIMRWTKAKFAAQFGYAR